jgi:hypothetical protein
MDEKLVQAMDPNSTNGVATPVVISPFTTVNGTFHNCSGRLELVLVTIIMSFPRHNNE